MTKALANATTNDEAGSTAACSRHWSHRNIVVIGLLVCCLISQAFVSTTKTRSFLSTEIRWDLSEQVNSNESLTMTILSSNASHDSISNESTSNGSAIQRSSNTSPLPSDKEVTLQVPTTPKNLVLGPIFYNLFAPPDDPPYIQKIVQEQLDNLAQTQHNATNSTLSITLIGSDPNVRSLIRSYVLQNCPNRTTCSIRQEVDQGNEDLTLQALWEYCHETVQPDDSTDVLVTYIHDKGSFNPTESNNYARYRTTRAALECRNELLGTDQPDMCNTCAFLFHVHPQYLVDANMWTARCSYIRGLIPPVEFEPRVQEMYDSTVNHSVYQRLPRYLCLKPPGIAPNMWGVGRYAFEKWAFTHPYVKPCDVLGVPEIPSQKLLRAPPKPISLQKAPAGTARALGLNVGPQKGSWLRLVGRLFEWNYLYHLAPPPDSWVWSFYKGFENGTEVAFEYCLAEYQNKTVGGRRRRRL